MTDFTNERYDIVIAVVGNDVWFKLMFKNGDTAKEYGDAIMEKMRDGGPVSVHIGRLATGAREEYFDVPQLGKLGN